MSEEATKPPHPSSEARPRRRPGLTGRIGIGLVLGIAVGLFFDVVGCIGLVRLPDVYTRMQAATKCVALGTLLILAGAVLTVGTATALVKGGLCLAFLLMTLGPAILLLAAWDRSSGRVVRAFVTIGRVPLFYYVLHLYLIHAAAIALAAATGQPLATLLDGFHPGFKPPDSGFPLPVTYAVWAGVVVCLYPLCRWFAGVKQRRSEWWLSYL